MTDSTTTLPALHVFAVHDMDAYSIQEGTSDMDGEERFNLFMGVPCAVYRTQEAALAAAAGLRSDAEEVHGEESESTDASVRWIETHDQDEGWQLWTMKCEGEPLHYVALHALTVA